MVEASDPQGTQSPNPTQDKLVADIERTREQLGDTVDALAGKLDVKSQAKQKIDGTKERLNQQVRSVQSLGQRATDRAKDGATDDHGKIRPGFPVGAASAVVLVAFALLIWRRRR